MDSIQASVKICVQSPSIVHTHSRTNSVHSLQNQIDSGTVSEEGDALDSNSENIYNMTRLQLTDWTEASANRMSNGSSDFEDVIITNLTTPDIISSSEDDELHKRLRHNFSNLEQRKRHSKRGRHSSEEELLNIIGWTSPVRTFNNSHSKISGKGCSTTLTELNGPRVFDSEVENLLHDKMIYSLVDGSWNFGYYNDHCANYFEDHVSPRKRHCSSPPRPSLNFYKMQRTSLMENEFAVQPMGFSAKSLNDFHENCKSPQNIPQFCFRSLAKTFI